MSVIDIDNVTKPLFVAELLKVRERNLTFQNLDDILICNPGSTSLPKEESKPGFAIYEKGIVSLYDLDGNLIKKADV